MRGSEFILCVSFANLCLLNIWASLQNRTTFYHRGIPLSYSEIGAVTLTVVLLSAVFALTITFMRRVRNPWLEWAARLGFLVLLIVPLRNIRLQFGLLGEPLQFVFEHTGRPGLIAGLAVVLAAAAYWSRQAIAGARVLLFVLAPLFVVNLANSLWIAHALRGQPYAARKAPIMKARAPVGARVVLLLFDELDYRLAFAERPPGIRMPEFDRLRSGSVFARNTRAAQSETVLSVPSILSGREVKEARSATSNQLVLVSSSGTVLWGSVPNIFSEARQSGIRTALAGWYHPYCRVLGESLDDCVSVQGVSDRPEWAHGVSLVTNMRLQLRRQLAAFPLVHLYRDSSDVARPEHRREYLSIHSRALEYVVNPAFGLVYLHYPVPHPPGMFDPATDDFDLEHPHGYVDNLPLVDHTLRDLRAAMERAGTWNSTTLILTADHPLRTRMWPGEEQLWGAESPLVPFIIKLAGEERGLEFTPRINNRVIHDLVLALLAGELRTRPELEHWLDAHSQAGHVGPEVIARRQNNPEAH